VTNYSPPSTQNVNGYETASGGNVLFRWTRTAQPRRILKVGAVLKQLLKDHGDL
jgi:hypothetical protein